MKYLLIIITMISIFSCTSDDDENCKICEEVYESNQAAVDSICMGFNADPYRYDRISAEDFGTLCNEELISREDEILEAENVVTCENVAKFASTFRTRIACR